MFTPATITGYKYLNLLDEEFTKIEPWLVNLGLKYFEGHPILPDSITEQEIQVLILTLCPTKQWEITHRLGKTVVTAINKSSAVEAFKNLPWGETRWDEIVNITPNYPWEQVEMYFLGQFEVYYNELDWDIEEARKVSYKNTVNHFSGLSDWESALQQFKNTYEEKNDTETI